MYMATYLSITYDLANAYIHWQMPERITLKETSTHRLAGRRKTVIFKAEMIYVPLLETLEAQLNTPIVLKEVHTVRICMYV